ncbi:hypothetical protein [Alkaliphilus peptidifermentans]|uniref:Uncharacterized protein n=1 Tax=Alkaliphilus peptidifermentans DSM 18978 TaxID=1120976 RepID=A0A1G5HSQ6_9FIRM|nr:hypothetical protein [Alkaliphilus peptidifermentans]SCY66754.1 hypothetical protein SAMN03080606_02117 [Alkaliphilus peptidifermentans DSM 18978]
MKKMIIMLILVCSFVVPGVMEINAYKEYGSDTIVYEDTISTFITADNLRH